MIEWISVKKQMPTVCGDYLVCYPAHCGGQQIDIAHITDDVFTIWDSRFGEHLEMWDVTHWAHMTYPAESKVSEFITVGLDNPPNICKVGGVS